MTICAFGWSQKLLFLHVGKLLCSLLVSYSHLIFVWELSLFCNFFLTTFYLNTLYKALFSVGSFSLNFGILLTSFSRWWGYARNAHQAMKGVYDQCLRHYIQSLAYHAYRSSCACLGLLLLQTLVASWPLPHIEASNMN